MEVTRPATLTETYCKQLTMLADTIGSSSSIKSREAGLKSLVTLLDTRSRSLDGLSDKHYHRIFESLFSCSVIEQRSAGVVFSGGSRSVAAAKSRLLKVAEALRLTLHHGAAKLKRKTVRAVIDHIVQTYSHYGLDEHGTLKQVYLKCLVAVLTPPANAEHLAASKDGPWFDCFDFCLSTLSEILEATDADAASRASPAPSLSLSSHTHTGRSSSLNGRRQASQHSENRIAVQGLLHCIHLLLLPANAPLRRRAQVLAGALIKVLRLPYVLGTITLYAFSCLNILFENIQADDIKLAKSVAQDVVPLVRQWWEPRTMAKDDMQNSVRDELLKVVLNVHLHLEHMASNPDSSVLAEVQLLSEVLWREYARRDERSQLQLDDITFTTSVLPPDHFQTRAFGLRPHYPEGERKWALTLNLALLEQIIWQSSGASSIIVEAHDEDQPRKRRRTSTRNRRLKDKLGCPDTSQAALQILPFLCDLGLDLADLRADVATHVAAGTPWAMVAYAGLTANHGLDDTWKLTWLPAIRALDQPNTCRAASFLLRVMLGTGSIPYQSIANDINSIVTTANVNGPKVLVDSSIQLMTQLQSLRNAKLPNASQETSMHIIQWSLARWAPAQSTYTLHHSLPPHPTELVNLLLGCSGTKMMELHPIQLAGGTISQAWSRHLNSSAAVRYLLLLPELSAKLPLTESTPKPEPVIDTASHIVPRTLILELLFLKLEELNELCRSWTKPSSEGGTKMSPEKLQRLLSACVVGAVLAPHLANCNTRQSRDIEPLIFGLLHSTLATISTASENNDLYNIVLREMAWLIPPISASRLQTLVKDSGLILRLIVSVAGSLRKRVEKESSSKVDDGVDWDDDFESQESRVSTVLPTFDMPRHNIALRLNHEAFAQATTARIYFLEALLANPDHTDSVPSSFVHFICGLPSESLLLCGNAIVEIVRSEFSLGDDGARLVVEKIGDIIGDVRLASCEVAQSTVLNIMEGLMHVWLDKNSDIYSNVQDLYQYFVDQSLPQNALSPQSQNVLANLLFRLLREEPGYGADAGSASSRTTLLLIMQQSGMVVQHSIAVRLPDIFGLFVLKMHDDVFVDILESLPTDPEVIEGIAFRLLVLSELAFRWPTLLRRCTYHIFEVPGKVPASTDYATRCLARVSESLRLNSPRELFALFTPQLLYTWLEEESIDDMPFKIFGFESLRQMLQTSQAEAAALMLMRHHDDKAEQLAQHLSTTYPELIRQGFAKIVAYAIAQDTSLSRQGSASAEGRIRNTLGNEPYIDGIYANFADIVAIMFDIFDQENPIEKYFAQDDKFSYAANIMDEIKKYSHSDVSLPANQQPMFKAKYLLRQLFHLCNRTEYELHSLWTPAMVVSVARRLFNSIHPALGSLHACSALRKVRVLICLSGPAALDQYPAEMLLHSIRPLIVDSECADDALGMSRYLITRASEYLKYAPSFLAGYGLSTLASLRVFLESSQSSTTQESQFKATMTKAQQFHAWLSDYLNQFESPYFVDEEQRSSFKTITQTAAAIRSSGNAESSSNESSLLLEILRDEKREKRLLNEPARELALGLLCGDFMIPAYARNDILSTDEAAAQHSDMVWTSCKAGTLSDEYLAWAGRVMGRSFAATGEMQSDFLRESKLSKSLDLVQSDTSGEGLIRLLQRLISNKDSFTAGLAESSLRMAISEAVAVEDKQLITAAQTALSEQLFTASSWHPYRAPPSDNGPRGNDQELNLFSAAWIERAGWIQDLAAYLVQTSSDDILLTCLRRVVLHDKTFAEDALPFIIHLALFNQLDRQQSVKRQLSEAIREWLGSESDAAMANQRHIINALLYLRTQALPKERSIADRSQWLDVDYGAIGSASSRCGMHKTALLFMEIAASQVTRVSRRTSAAREEDNTEDLLQIFQNIDDPDAYYGIPQPASLAEVLSRGEYENDGKKSLTFRDAVFTGHIRRRDPAAHSDAMAIVGALSILGLPGTANSLLGSLDHAKESNGNSLQDTFDLARRLETWNLPAPVASENHAVTMYKAFQKIQQASDIEIVRKAVYSGYIQTMRTLAGPLNPASLRGQLGALAALTELDDAVNVADFAELEELLRRFEQRSQWMRRGRFLDVRSLLSCRETTFSLMSQHSSLRGGLSPAQARQTEISCKLISSGIYRYHRATKECLNLWTDPDLIGRCEQLGLSVDAIVQFELARSMWDHGEVKSSIRMLQALDAQPLLKKQSIPVSRSELLSKIGHQVSTARLEKPHDIQNNYLAPALKELKGNAKGKEAGQVFHQFAMFCDDQLQNPDALEDLARLRKLRKGKSDEVMQLKNLVATAKPELRDRYKSHLIKAKSWLDLDEQELRRLEMTRAEFVRLSLENYLLCLIASDEFNNDALRFTALWLERADEEATNEAIRKHLNSVPTRKFAMLMNQLSSRLQDRHDSPFQQLLLGLVRSICIDHPYHGMYHVWSSAKVKLVNKDDVAIRRQKAAERLAKDFERNDKVGEIWHAIDRTSGYYHRLASEKNEKFKAGQKIALRDSTAAYQLVHALGKYKIPPPTMQIELEAGCDYSNVPTISRLEPQMTIASGVSAPKIITVVGSDGQRYRQLVKGGSDDLRQDAIMEQVFAAVSALLARNRETQQRNLGIRTYKVLPLTAVSGLIEFVPNTIPLHEFLMPAHERYHPKDLKGSQCRKEISSVQGKSAEARITTYRKVKEKFQPVMKYFFLEYFMDPDEWFAKRTAYTRTTAAISMLGHVLGLGDRHGHNILLDHKTGEVVHIDLGVAFEMGRVLPVPELVPFRLTRDIVDGMGLTKTEGVFRRCCEFTLDALREEQYSIMTILDVLRYDPLYSWSISPLRLAKLQDRQELEPGVSRGPVDEASEADRALEVVRKKLSKTLSVEATVNDLINQATDERNLALLYSGWAAYA